MGEDRECPRIARRKFNFPCQFKSTPIGEIKFRHCYRFYFCSRQDDALDVSPVEFLSFGETHRITS